ncbi:hypothetical protein [Bifidobacterium pseudolongum]|uniref:Uncharacterized protein n=1 Tax=Bifidobacterium pseudolongum subsp. globosum TaxID=1690 RepID=A0A8B3RQX2_9BIFI|nr:hypothetical protein [Bifidobacterium pseudolongum]RYQ48357.1 hypothetical protein PG1780B_0005 [Bifidobacterium pseudolongum subsp. globosum]
MGQAVGVMACATPMALMNVILDCVQGKRTLPEALQKHGVDVVLAGSIQYVIGFIQISAAGLMKNAASERVQAIAKTNALSAAASLAFDNAMLIKRLARNEITCEEFLDVLAETNIATIASMFAGAVVGPAAGVAFAPIIANMIAVQVATGSYQNLRQAIQEYQIAKQERIEAEVRCAQIVEQTRVWRQQLNEQSERYFAKHLAAFDTAFRAMDRAILEQDSDGFIHANAQLQQVLEYEPQFSSQQEFDDLMNDGDSFRL